MRASPWVRSSATWMPLGNKPAESQSGKIWRVCNGAWVTTLRLEIVGNCGAPVEHAAVAASKAALTATTGPLRRLDRPTTDTSRITRAWPRKPECGTASWRGQI
ncbi:hypothetical protein GCM10027053_07200 [Intrasporangium mesophilum]